MPATSIVTVGMNPAVDRILEVRDFRIGAHQAGRELLRSAGGKALNVSRALAHLGVHSIATGFLGEANRFEFAPLLEHDFVNDELFPLPGRTRENVTITDPVSGTDTHIRDVGLEVPPRSLERLRKKLHLLAARESIIAFSGSLPPGVSPEVFADLVDSCTAAGARVSVDTTGAALRAMAGRRLWLIKPNALELATLAGRDLQTLDEQIAAARALTAHCEIVIFTRGAHGAYLFRKDLALHAYVEVAPTRVVNTVGCGDSLLAGFMAGTWREQPIRQIFTEAVACATASAFTFSPADFDTDEFFALQEKVVLTEL